MNNSPVVADSHSQPFALEIAHANAELFCDFKCGAKSATMVRAARGLTASARHFGRSRQGLGSDARGGTALRYAAP